MTPWDGQAQRIYDANGTYPTTIHNNSKAVCYVMAHDSKATVSDSGRAFTLAASDWKDQQYLCYTTDSYLHKYIVRRLTPLECCRLQGFPDGWGKPDAKESMTGDEVVFWKQVYKTHAEMNGKKITELRGEDAVVRWYNGLHSDANEYKMWGNGIALPCALFVMEGIAEVAER